LPAPPGPFTFLWAACIGTSVAAVLGAIIALPPVRLGSVFLAIWSLAAAFFFAFVPFAYEPIGHGQLGWTILAPSLDIPGLNWLHDLLVKGKQPKLDFSQLPDQILLFLVLFGAITLIIHALQRS